MDCSCESEPCICAQLDEALLKFEEVRVGKSAFIDNDHFDVGVGEVLKTGVKMVNLHIHGTNPQTGELVKEAVTMSFDKQSCASLIHCLMLAYQASWSGQ